MATKAFSLQDGNLNKTTIKSARAREYIDIDLLFAERPSGDIYKKKEAAAVKQAVKNLLLTSETEKPFNPTYGANLNSALFDLDTNYEPKTISDLIANAISIYEPRANVLSVTVNTIPERNELRATIEFEVINIGEVVTLELNLARLR
jgi:phage baseplate assembly protein W